MRLILPLALAALVALPAGAQQGGAYVQIEAHPSRAEAVERADAYGALFDGAQAFALRGRWHAVALGPYRDAATARAELARLRAEGLIPRDSYVAERSDYGEQVWVGGAVASVGTLASEPRAAPEPSAAETAAETAADETPGAARRSERRLDRAAREDLQRALRWFGHYGGAIDAAFGRGTRASMAAWQSARGAEATGVLTTRQRAVLLEEWRAARAALDLRDEAVPQAGVAMTLPMGLIAFERVEAPFVHYGPRRGSGVTLSVISQAGGPAALAGLFEVIGTLDVIPAGATADRGPRAFSLGGSDGDRAARAVARLVDGHIVGFILSWPTDRALQAGRALAAMEDTLRSVGAPLDPDAGFDAAAQRVDRVAGLAVRQPIRAGSGFFVAVDGTVATAADLVEGCGRVTIGRRHAASVTAVADGIALLAPAEALAPPAVATLAGRDGRLRSRIAVSGFPYGGTLGGASLNWGTLEDVRGLDGSADRMRLALSAGAGEVGGPVVDASGRVAGLLLPDPADGRTWPSGAAVAVKAARLAALLDGAALGAAAPDEAVQAAAGPRTARSGEALPPERLAARAAGITVLVDCWD